MDSALVSVIIPTYNREDFLNEAIQSVFEQTYDDLEVIIVDDDSETDIEARLNHSYINSNRVEIIRHQVNRGGAAARNTGIKAANGEYIAFLDDDDLWLENKISKQVEMFSKKEDIGVVYTGTSHINLEKNEILREHVPRVRGNVLRELLYGNFVETFSAVMVDATVLDECGDLDERFPTWQDWEWLVRIATNYQFEVVSEPLVIHRTSDHDQLGDNLEETVKTTYPLFINKYSQIAREEGVIVEKKMKAWASFRVACSAISNAHFDLGRRYILKSIKQYPLSWNFYVILLISAVGPRYRMIQSLLPEDVNNILQNSILNRS